MLATETRSITDRNLSWALVRDSSIRSRRPCNGLIAFVSTCRGPSGGTVEVGAPARRARALAARETEAERYSLSASPPVRPARLVGILRWAGLKAPGGVACAISKNKTDYSQDREPLASGQAGDRKHGSKRCPESSQPDQEIERSPLPRRESRRNLNAVPAT